jgi:hypothetical protein
VQYVLGAIGIELEYLDVAGLNNPQTFRRIAFEKDHFTSRKGMQVAVCGDVGKFIVSDAVEIHDGMNVTLH